jgi:hypothetical protein
MEGNVRWVAALLEVTVIIIGFCSVVQTFRRYFLPPSSREKIKPRGKTSRRSREWTAISGAKQEPTGGA